MLPTTIADADIVLTSAARTAIGKFMGGLSATAPTDLAAMCVREAVARSGAAHNAFDHCVFGHVVNTEPRDMYLARVAAIEGGLSETTPALTLNRLCGSGLQAIITAAQIIALGDVEAVVAGGAECMSRGPHTLREGRDGKKMGDITLIDMMTGALTDPFGMGHMGVTAENVAAEWSVDRNAQDELALESHRRAAVAVREGRFKNQILPVTVKVGRAEQTIDTDEHIRPDATLEDMTKLRPAFGKDGSVTAGNASGINDGAAAVTLMTANKAVSLGVTPMARILSYGHAGVAPRVMGVGPINAVRQALERAKLTVADLDVIESNEAFAAQACAVARELQFPADKTNPNGGAIALGHPIGATGAILTVKTLYELKRTEGRYGLVTMCIGGGQGIAMVIEALH